MSKTTRDDVIQDLQELIEKHGTVTRDFYRENGEYTDAAWGKYFAGWKDFLAAAGVNQETEEHKITDDTWTINMVTRICTLPELLAHCKVDEKEWFVKDFVLNKWEMGYTTHQHGVKKASYQPLFQVKAVLSKRQAVSDTRKILEEMMTEWKLNAPIPTPVVRHNIESGNLLEIVVPDLHAMKLAWDKETGYTNYDVREAERLYDEAIDTLITEAGRYKIDHVLLVVGNDLFNSDNLNSTTTKGTHVSTDTRFQKGYKIVRQMIVRNIEKLRRVAPVTVKIVPGNHDTLSAFTLGDSLECWFHNYTDVDIDNQAISHKFFKWGDVFLMLLHGDKGKKDDYGLWMATERPKEFGDSKFREVHIGHLHKTKLDEKFGVRVRTLSALTPPDGWHAENGFVGN
jgi:hypothetical protein